LLALLYNASRGLGDGDLNPGGPVEVYMCVVCLARAYTTLHYSKMKK